MIVLALRRVDWALVESSGLIRDSKSCNFLSASRTAFSGFKFLFDQAVRRLSITKQIRTDAQDIFRLLRTNTAKIKRSLPVYYSLYPSNTGQNISLRSRIPIALRDGSVHCELLLDFQFQGNRRLVSRLRPKRMNIEQKGVKLKQRQSNRSRRYAVPVPHTLARVVEKAYRYRYNWDAGLLEISDLIH